MAVRFDGQSMIVPQEKAELRLGLRGFGRPGRVRKPQEAGVETSGNRIEYRRGSLTEWYVNGRRGVEQGFRVDGRPSGDGPLVLALAVDGGFEVREDGPNALLFEREGCLPLRYEGLKAWDAKGRVLPARMAAAGSGFRLEVDDAGAAYPVTVDPWIVQAKLTGGPGQYGRFGGSGKLSGDTAVVASTSEKALYVFVREGTGWVEQARIPAPDVVAGETFPAAYDLYGDTLVVGVSAVGIPQRATPVYVFVRNGADWSLQATLASGRGTLGYGPAVGIWGDTLVVGVEEDNAFQGAAYVFTRNGAAWNLRTKLIAANGDRLGYGVLLNRDTAFVSGGPGDAIHVFVGSGSTWTEQAAIVSPTGNRFTSAVLEGDRALFGDYYAENQAGRAYVFERENGAWSQKAELRASDSKDGNGFGSSVTLSGATALVSSSKDGGAVYQFDLTGGQWIQRAKLTNTPADPTGDFGYSISLSGTTALIGDPAADAGEAIDAGAAYIYHTPCNMSLLLSYEAGTLQVGYNIAADVAGTWSAWLVGGSGLRPLWKAPIPVILPSRSGTFQLPDVPASGFLGIISGIATSGGLSCSDFQVIDTGGTGATEEQIRAVAAKSGWSVR